LDALSGMRIAQAGRKQHVCRNWIYAQKNEAEAAVDHVFAEKTQTTVLFYLPVSTHIISTGKREFSDRLLPA
jgi:hypothetical protein